MKMLNNVLEGGAFAISRVPIQSPRCTKMGEAVLPCAAPPPETPAQVHHHHHAEDVALAVAVAEHVDVVDDRECKKDIKTVSFLLPSKYHVWPMSKCYGP